MATEFTEVEFAGQTIEVPKGGYYDRYRSNPNLDEVAQDPAAGNIDWFRRIPKVLVESRVGPILLTGTQDEHDGGIDGGDVGA